MKESLSKVLNGENPGTVAEEDHRIWYRELISTSVTAGIVNFLIA